MKQAIKVSFFSLLATAVLFTACKKQEGDSQGNGEEKDVLKSYEGLPLQTMNELTQARAATAKYQQIENAFKDGYEDINVVMQNMGYHFRKLQLVDSTFDVRKPEILVYNKRYDGQFELVAVEYAVPLSLSPNAPPEGFTGTDDHWDRNLTFQLWTLHAWVWKFNPHGVFSAMNPLVIVQ